MGLRAVLQKANVALRDYITDWSNAEWLKDSLNNRFHDKMFEAIVLAYFCSL